MNTWSGQTRNRPWSVTPQAECLAAHIVLYRLLKPFKRAFSRHRGHFCLFRAEHWGWLHNKGMHLVFILRDTNCKGARGPCYFCLRKLHSPAFLYQHFTKPDMRSCYIRDIGSSIGWRLDTIVGANEEWTKCKASIAVVVFMSIKRCSWKETVLGNVNCQVIRGGILQCSHTKRTRLFQGTDEQTASWLA